MPVELYDLPFDMLEMIGQSYDDLAKRDAAATLQAALKRHLLTRCDNPRHTSRTNTPGEAPVLCYQYCHKHPRGVKCWATRAEYFNRILAQHGRKKRGRVWA
jgi:hypothetical protein